MATWLRAAVMYAIATALLVAGFSVGRLWGVAAATVVALAFVAARIVVPRAAHRAFATGRYRRALQLYRGLGWIRVSDHAQACVAVSRAGCLVALHRVDEAESLVASLNDERCPESARAARLNNRAYGLVRSQGDRVAAVEAARQAVELRPKVAGFHHTLGAVYLARGEVDEAIRCFGRAWELGSGDEPLLEAERCFDLARAWRQKGEADYANDYFERAWRAAPESEFSEQAKRELREHDHTAQLSELLV